MKKIVKILNYSQNLSEENLIKYIRNYSEFLVANEINNIEFKVNDSDCYESIGKIVQKITPNSKAIDSDDLLGKINNCEGTVYAILGEQFNTYHPWGDARDFITIIKNIYEKNIWHEISHLLGAKDHYEVTTKFPLKICSSNNCIMQYGKTEGYLCEMALEEIRVYLKEGTSEKV